MNEISPVKVKVLLGKSIFSTKTFRAGVIAFLTGALPIIFECYYTERLPTLDESTALLGLVTTLGFLISGRATTQLVYTPNNLPGLDKADFELGLDDLETYIVNKRNKVVLNETGDNKEKPATTSPVFV